MPRGTERILLTGSTGQVGRELAGLLAPMGELITPRRDALDLAAPGAVRAAIDAIEPGIIVNAAGYTDVDGAEAEEPIATAINAQSVGQLAAAAASRGVPLVHLSTDYIFDGLARRPYRPDDETNPINAYGRTKLAGEEAIRDSGCEHFIIRTSWVYSLRGRSFLRTMLRLGESQDNVRVVDDQHGAPTWSRSLAHGLAEMIRLAWDTSTGGLRGLSGTYHLTCEGETTWCGFAQAIFERAGLNARIEPIATMDYPTPARRPRYSVLDCASTAERFDVRLPKWSVALEACLAKRPQPVAAREGRRR